MHNGFRNHLESIGRKDRTVTEYVRLIRRADRWLRAELGTTIEAARPADVRAWAETTPFSWATRNMARNVIGQWQRWARHPYDLASAIPCPRKPRGECRAPEDEEVRRLVDVALDDALAGGNRGVALLLGCYLGMRCSEIASASWSGYDGREFSWLRAKSGDPAKLPVNPVLARALDAQTRWSPYVFPSSVRRSSSPPHVTPQTVWDWIVKLSTDAGVRVTTHQLRHASIAQVVDKHGLLVGQEWAGHRDPRTTRIYSRVRRHQLRDAMQSLDWGDNRGDGEVVA